MDMLNTLPVWALDECFAEGSAKLVIEDGKITGVEE